MQNRIFDIQPGYVRDNFYNVCYASYFNNNIEKAYEALVSLVDCTHTTNCSNCKDTHHSEDSSYLVKCIRVKHSHHLTNCKDVTHKFNQAGLMGKKPLKYSIELKINKILRRMHMHEIAL